MFMCTETSFIKEIQMKVCFGLITAAWLLVVAMLMSSCGDKIQVTTEQYEQWTEAERELNSAQQGDLLLLSSGRVCLLVHNGGTRIHADCKDGSPDWKSKHNLAPQLMAIVSRNSTLHSSYASAYLKQ